MKIVAMKCPECGASLEYKEGQSKYFCGYCGKPLVLDNDQEFTYRIIDLGGEEMVINIKLKKDREALRQIEWLFDNTIYDTEEDFVAAFIAYNDHVRNDTEIVSSLLKAEITNGKKKEELKHFFSIYADLNEEDDYGSLKCIHIMTKKETVASLLMEIHNRLAPYKRAEYNYLYDKVYFEGFSYGEGALILNLGSAL